MYSTGMHLLAGQHSALYHLLLKMCNILELYIIYEPNHQPSEILLMLTFQTAILKD